MKFMLELNERYSDVTFRIMVVKSARGDTPTRANMFQGLSGNKMLDTFNRERFSILVDKWTKLKARGMTEAGPELATGEGNNRWDGAGLGINGPVSSRATKIVKIWIPGSKFVKSGVIQYDNGGTNAKFFDYHTMVYAYSNYSTLQDVYNVGRINDYIKIMYFKDA